MVLILHPGTEAPADGPRRLADALTGLGAKIMLHGCDERYDEILDAVEWADTIVFWR